MKKLWVLSIIGLVLTGCSQKEAAAPVQAAPVVYTVNYPLAYFADTIAGGVVQVVFPEMEGDPAFWEPTPEQIGEFQKADLILLNGAGYAKWVSKVSLPQSRLVDTSAAFKDELIAIDDSVTHTHGPEGAHAHGNVAFTTWLDPRLAAQQLAAIQFALSTQGMVDEAKVKALEDQLADLDAQLEQAFARFEDQPLLGSHPVYQYLTQRYGLNLKSVHWEPDVLPDEAMLQELDKILKMHPAKIMLWEGTPMDKTVALLASRGISCVVFDPCGNRPENGDYMQVMQENARVLKLQAE
jgi:zinc transport system substrate-binding protein